MGRPASRLWALLLAAALGLPAALLAEARTFPRRPGPPKPMGTPKKPERLPAMAWQVAEATSRA